MHFSNNSLYSHFFVDTFRHFVDYYLFPGFRIYYLWVIIKRQKNNSMKNQTNNTGAQVETVAFLILSIGMLILGGIAAFSNNNF